MCTDPKTADLKNNDKLYYFLLYHRCVYKHTKLHTHHTQTQNDILWITQKVASCGNRTSAQLLHQLCSHFKLSMNTAVIRFNTE
ncbi:hypothetical protein SFRURICE_020046 [Spodoptera frugiperda]|nr:hypothetical protein SFRURICE_020046 [Spodoptera frugiperda]